MKWLEFIHTSTTESNAHICFHGAVNQSVR